MNKEQSMEKIKKLLVMQQCTGATKHEEITCFKKALELALIYDLKEVNLDAVSRHIYNLEHDIENTKILEGVVEDSSFEAEPGTEEYDFEYKPRLKNNLVKNITLENFLGGLLARVLKGLSEQIQGSLPFIIWIVIPTIIILLVK